MMFAVLSTSCSKNEETPQKEEEPSEITKPTATTFKFASTSKTCGITDGYANQQHTLPELVHLNTDKCNGETYRPTITLTFGENPIPGTYNVTEASPSGKQVKISSSQYNSTNWNATKGTVVVTKNEDNATKVDIELKSITLRNENAANDTKNPATDTLTGFIIKI